MAKTKIKFKTKLFALQDMLVTKNMSKKSRDYIRNLAPKTVEFNYHINNIANSLHPQKQIVKVVEIIKHKCDAKTFILKSANSKQLAYFKAGQYLSVSVNINGVKTTRPYSISSSPEDVIKRGFYAITIKRKKDGLISEYFMKKIKINDHLDISDPQGEFYYNELRDPSHVLAIAAGSGITPFISMAKAIVEKTENFSLTILISNQTCDSILFHKELTSLESLSNGKVKIIHTLTRERKPKFHYGHFTLALIKKYMTTNTAIWMCGPKKMYIDMLDKIKPLRLLRKNLRIEQTNDIGFPNSYQEYKNTGHKNFYKINIKQFDEQYSIVASANDTILVSLQKAKLSTQSKCLSGSCSWCRIKVVNGNVFTPIGFAHLRAADKPNKIYHSCSTFPISDLDIEVN